MAAFTIKNESPLSTFLATATAGAPSITATQMVQLLTPISFNYTDQLDTDPKNYGLNVTTVDALSNAKFDSLVSYTGATPYGVKISDVLALVLQASKENIRYLTTATTNGSGVATVDLTPFGFSTAPKVMLTCQNASTTQAVVAHVSAVSATSLTIRTFISQPVLLLGGNPVTTVSTLVNISLSP